MRVSIIQSLKTASGLFILLSILTGIIYPFCISGIGQAFFNQQANGSLIVKNNQVIGSSLIGQSFSDPRYFWSRPSATANYPYNAQSSSPSNLGPTNPQFMQQVQARILNLTQTNPNTATSIPIDLVTSSGSGLDPDISPQAAYYQAQRIADARHLPIVLINKLIKTNIVPRQFGLLGEPYLNVLLLNLSLDSLDDK